MRKLFIVTNRNIITKGNIVSIINEAALAGADAIILREKDLQYDELLELARKIKAITDLRNIPLIVNGNLDVADSINAAGFHTNFNCFVSNDILYSGIKGVSVHCDDEAIKAERKGADYILAGHVFETDCKKGLKGRGISFIREICKSVSIPVIAIGGINEFNAAKVLEAGASGIAVMSSIMSSEDVFNVVKRIKKVIS